MTDSIAKFSWQCYPKDANKTWQNEKFYCEGRKRKMNKNEILEKSRA